MVFSPLLLQPIRRNARHPHPLYLQGYPQGAHCTSQVTPSPIWTEGMEPLSRRQAAGHATVPPKHPPGAAWEAPPPHLTSPTCKAECRQLPGVAQPSAPPGHGRVPQLRPAPRQTHLRAAAGIPPHAGGGGKHLPAPHSPPAASSARKQQRACAPPPALEPSHVLLCSTRVDAPRL